jgi:ribosomal protein S12 methylthiotransferase
LKATVYLESLGCAKNLVDSEIIAGQLNKTGYGFTTSAEDADIIIVNTCAFIEDAVQEAFDTIHRLATLKQKGNCRTLVVAGCLPQRYGNKLTAKSNDLIQVDLFVGVGEFHNIAQLLEETSKDPAPGGNLHLEGDAFLPDHTTPRIRATAPHTAYLKIAEGCSHNCSFCTIPAIKGPYRSRKPESVIAEGQMLAESGVKELNLIAQDTTAYGYDLPGKTDLGYLLKHLSRDSGLEWIRILYGHPKHLSQDILTVMGEEEKVCSYIDLPLQHISNAVLGKMGRRTKASMIKKLVGQMRRIIPDLWLRTTFIVGFPGESEDDFRLLLDFVNQIEFEHLGAFKYSDEEGTKAYGMKNKVQRQIIEDRFHQLMSAQSLISLHKNQALIGTTQKVLIEGVDSTSGILTGRTSFQAPDIDGIVFITKGSAPSGALVEVTITDAAAYDLFGEIKKQSTGTLP